MISKKNPEEGDWKFSVFSWALQHKVIFQRRTQKKGIERSQFFWLLPFLVVYVFQRRTQKKGIERLSIAEPVASVILSEIKISKKNPEEGDWKIVSFRYFKGEFRRMSWKTYLVKISRVMMHKISRNQKKCIKRWNSWIKFLLNVVYFPKGK